MSDFKPGDIVNITIKGAVVVNSYTTGRKPVDGPREDTGTVLVFRHPDLERFEDRTHTVNLKADGVTVERAVPEHWPPFHNDVWRDRANTLWVCGNDGWGPRMYSAVGDMEPDKALREHGLTALVHREEPPF